MSLQNSPLGGLWSAGLLAVALHGPCAAGADLRGAAQFHKDIEPILTQYCFDCHADGVNKGDVAFDAFASDQDLLTNRDLWWNALKYLRAGMMPPEKKARPTPEEQQRIATWIKTSVFGINPANPDPGRVTLRRLNRVEYRNSIRDLLGVDFNTDTEFPPDDTGYGFDDIGDVLTLSPMLFEKYIAAARDIVARAVPVVSGVMPEVTLAGGRFADTSAGVNNNSHRRGRNTVLSLPYARPASLAAGFKAPHDGSYQVDLLLAVRGGFDFNPAKCLVTFKLDGRELLKKEFGWQDNKTFPPFQFNEKLPIGPHDLTFTLQPLTNDTRETNLPEMRLVSVTVRGPSEKAFWTHPKNYARFFPKDPPASPAERRAYAREILRDFAGKAFRRPVNEKTLDRLTKFAEGIYSEPGNTFESGVARAMVVVLSSPNFLFRVEENVPDSSPAGWSQIDEYSLASRLSYFLWSTTPDAELLNLAAHRELRQNLSSQVKRLLADPRSAALVQNFTGQWLQARDLAGVSVDARVVLARDSGPEKPTPPARANPPGAFKRGNQSGPPRFELTGDVRQAMKRETEMFFASVMREDRSVTDLIDARYTFLNEKLAAFYGLTNLHVTGPEMRRVTLPDDSPRGGVLTEGTVLVVTSNPDRTSPVKRGLFVLNNILGTPAPPPPPNVPALEASEKDFKDHPPTLRAALELHRSQPLCASCHARMDPIGLGMEHFNAMGIWRDRERGQKIETAGTLITGESFDNVRQLKRILAHDHRTDFYRCLTEKMLTYALGRGLEYYDVESVDKIVRRLDQEDGRFSALLTGIIESAPFQEQRTRANPAFSDSAEPPPKSGPGPDSKNKSTP